MDLGVMHDLPLYSAFANGGFSGGCSRFISDSEGLLRPKSTHSQQSC
jgi:hypothetical protein